MKQAKEATTHHIAQQTLDIIPSVMLVMASAMRATGHIVVGGHLRLLGILTAGSMTLTQLADLNMVSPPTMSNTVSALESRGWVRRVRSNQDRRIVFIELTDEGTRVYNEIETHTRERIMVLLEPLDENERHTLVSALGLLRKKFEVGLVQPSPRD